MKRGQKGARKFYFPMRCDDMNSKLKKKKQNDSFFPTFFSFLRL